MESTCRSQRYEVYARVHTQVNLLIIPLLIIRDKQVFMDTAAMYKLRYVESYLF